MKFPLAGIPLSILFLSLIILSTFIIIPLPWFSFNLQFLTLLLCVFLLPVGWSFFTIGTYILVGLCGLPVFVHGGGFSYLKEPSFGYLMGFLLSTLLAGFFCKKILYKKVNLYIFLAMLTILLIHFVQWGYTTVLDMLHLLEEPFSFWNEARRIPTEILLGILAAWIAFLLHKALSRFLGTSPNQRKRT